MRAKARNLGAAFALGVLVAVGNLSEPAFAAPADEMIAADKAFSQMSAAQGAHKAFLAYMAEDVRLFDGPTPPLTGKAAVAAYYAAHPEMAGAKLTWAPLDAEASGDGDLGFTRGRWTYAMPQGPTLTGYYVTVWKRQSDGQYKFTLDIGGSDPKPAP